MPSWDIHSKYALKLWGINSLEVDRYVDEVCHHDIGRLIIEQVWDLRELVPTAKFIYDKFGEPGLKAFLLHHVLDYLDSLLRSLPVLSTGGFPKAFSMTVKTIENTISRLQEESPIFISALNIEEGFISLLVDALRDIQQLIEEEKESLLKDLDPISSESLRYVRQNLMKRICINCKSGFITLSPELRDFLTRLMITLPAKFYDLCPKCREEKLGTWIYSEYERIRRLFIPPLAPSPFHRVSYEGCDELWKEKMSKFWAIVAIVGGLESQD
jgi:hypothetical protein